MELKYMVDFDSQLAEIITETKHMEQLGFSVPELARNVALQEEKYIKYVDGLKHMLNRYHNVLASLDHAEVRRIKD
jgi:dynein heavy chain